jgi:translation initiation factor 2 beta subunit (eIF-2beta)/eIF-5
LDAGKICGNSQRQHQQRLGGLVRGRGISTVIDSVSSAVTQLQYDPRSCVNVLTLYLNADRKVDAAAR